MWGIVLSYCCLEQFNGSLFYLEFYQRSLDFALGIVWADYRLGSKRKANKTMELSLNPQRAQNSSSLRVAT